jgi:hypothetical protein
MKPEEEVIQLRADNQAQRDQLARQDEWIAGLPRMHTREKSLSTGSHKSHQPPSSDRFTRQSTSVRKASGKKPGGQEGHQGSPTSNLEQVMERCQRCQADMHAVAPHLAERRHVGDLFPVCLTETVSAWPPDHNRGLSQRGESPGASRSHRCLLDAAVPRAMGSRSGSDGRAAGLDDP